MWTRVKESLPPRDEVLAVMRPLHKSGEYIDELAMWDGKLWTRIKPNLERDSATFELNEVRCWRRLGT